MFAFKNCAKPLRKAAVARRIEYKHCGTAVRTLTDVTFKDGIRTITMNHPKTRNSLSLAMMQKLLDDVTRCQCEASLRAVVISGVGPVFSAGHNLKELSPEVGRAQHEKVFALSSKLMYAIIDSPVPIIARVDGLAAAAGCQLVAQCDLAFCTEKSTFSTPGASFGIFCSTPGVALARCVQKNTAMQMLLTGLPLSSEEALRAGLVNKVCTPETLDYEISKVCDAISLKSRAVVELGKRFFYKQIQRGIKDAYLLGQEVMVDNINMPDGQEGIRSFIEKRKPIWSN